MAIDQNLIYFTPGCYGTFLEWALTFLQGKDDSLPFESTGSSHLFKGNHLFPPELIFKYINSPNKCHLSRCHPNIFEKVNEHEQFHKHKFIEIIRQDLNFLKNHFNKILVLTFDERSTLWVENNALGKILISEEQYNKYNAKYGYSREHWQAHLEVNPTQRLRHMLHREIDSKNSSFKIENLLGWNKNSIYDFDLWELRELLSLYYFSSISSQITSWKTLEASTPDNLFIFVDSFKDTFVDTILKTAEYFNISVIDSKLKELADIYTVWKTSQDQMDKDLLCNQIVNSIVSNEYFDWSMYSLSIIDEAWIQKSLSDKDIQIKCYNLNTFPTNTKELRDVTR